MNTVSRPLARAQPSGAACLSLPSTGHNSPDPIALHMQALNCLSRCTAVPCKIWQPHSRLLQRCNPLICRWWEVSHASHPKKHVAAVAMQAEPRPEFPPCVLRPLGTVQPRTVG